MDDSRPLPRWGECYDCRRQSPMYMVRNPVWAAAWPEYRRLRAYLKVEHPDENVYLLLCFPCLEARLKRKLTIDDFDLNIAINHGILLGFEIGLSHAMGHRQGTDSAHGSGGPSGEVDHHGHTHQGCLGEIRTSTER